MNNTSLYVCTVIFNPFGFRSRIRLYNNFKKHMADSGAKLFTVEIAFGNKPFEVTTPHDPMNLQLRTSEIVWHKERGLNLAFNQLFHVVPDARYIGWYDADITFLNPNWVEDVTHKLTHVSVIQPFSQALNLNADEEEMWNCPSSFRSFIEGRGYHQTPPLPVSYTYKGHPGLAWNATREALEALGGLYDRCAAGSADTVMSNALKGEWDVYLPAMPSEGMRRSMAEWQKKADDSIQGRIGFVRGALAHHFHGSSEARGYEKRWSILSYHQFDPTKDLVLDHQGLYKWAGNKPKLEDDIRYSLSLRNEDSLT